MCVCVWGGGGGGGGGVSESSGVECAELTGEMLGCNAKQG